MIDAYDRWTVRLNRVAAALFLAAVLLGVARVAIVVLR